MNRRYSIAEARHDLARIVHELDDQPVIELTRRGEPVAVLVSFARYQRSQPAGASFWDAYTAFRTAYGHDTIETADVFDDVRDRAPGREVAL